MRFLLLKQILPFVKNTCKLSNTSSRNDTIRFSWVKTLKHLTGTSRDAVRIAEVRGRVAVGTTILGSVSMLNLTGVLTGGYHPDRNIRKQQQSQGFQPYSIKYQVQILTLNMED